MKKLFFTFAILFCTAAAFAQLEQGQHMINLRTGLGFQLNNSGINYSSYNDRVNWGTLGIELGLNYQYLISKHFGIGTDITIGDFDGGDFTWSASNNVDDQTHLYHFMLASRWTANPDKRVRVYIPFGAGLTAARQNLSIKYGGIEYYKKKTDTSLGLFIGAGLEFDVGNSGWSWGLETRYATFWYDTEKILTNAPSPIHGDGNRRYEYLMFNINISKRF